MDTRTWDKECNKWIRSLRAKTRMAKKVAKKHGFPVQTLKLKKCKLTDLIGLPKG